MRNVNFSELSDLLLVVMYQEPRTLRSLTDLKPLLRKYRLNAPEGLLSLVHQDLKRLGYISGPDAVGGDENAIAQLTPAGLRWVERQYGTKDGVGTILEPDDEYQENDTFQWTEITPGLDDSELPTADQPISSRHWTGASLAVINVNVLEEVRLKAKELREQINLMRFENNAESANLKGLANALVETCSMAEPEIGIIDRILASPKFKAYSGLLMIIATIRGALGI